MDDLLARHRRACDRFAAIATAIPDDGWDAPTPCTDWDARALVEHVIGFHEFLLLRPLGVRAHRPRDDEAARWRATTDALFAALTPAGALDQPTELPGGGESTPGTMLPALTTDVLVHTWDLARSAGLDHGLDTALCADAYAASHNAGFGRAPGMIGPEVSVPDDADVPTKLVAWYGRDPSWTPSHAR